MLRGRKLSRSRERKKKGKHKKQYKHQEGRVWTRRPNMESAARKKLYNVEAHMLQAQEFLSLKNLFLGILKAGEEIHLTGEVRTVQYPDGSYTLEVGVMFSRTYVRGDKKISLDISDCFINIFTLRCKTSFFAKLKKDVLQNRV